MTRNLYILYKSQGYSTSSFTCLNNGYDINNSTCTYSRVSPPSDTFNIHVKQGLLEIKRP